ncbi:MAG: AIM24 family protein, partial [Planctomycetota bacterium]
MEYTVEGVLNQVLRIRMEKGEKVWASKKSLVSFAPTVNWRVRVPGGFTGMLMRYFSGESFFLVHAQSADEGYLNLSSPEPSVIHAWDLADGPVTTLRGNFLAAVGDVSIEVGIARRPLAAIFGGAGFLLQTVYGKGTVFVAAKGDLTRYDLVDGQGIRVSTGNLAAFSQEIDYDIRFVGGCRKVLFGGEGALITRMAGPGTALTQSLKRKKKAARKLLKI